MPLFLLPKVTLHPRINCLHEFPTFAGSVDPFSRMWGVGKGRREKKGSRMVCCLSLHKILGISASEYHVLLHIRDTIGIISSQCLRASVYVVCALESSSHNTVF